MAECCMRAKAINSSFEISSNDAKKNARVQYYSFSLLDGKYQIEKNARVALGN